MKCTTMPFMGLWRLFWRRFSTTDKHTALIATFGIFAAGFLVRPFSAYWLGNLGDQIGRKKTLTITLMVMTFHQVLLVYYLLTKKPVFLLQFCSRSVD
ncbi:hypothetical protein PGH46_06545 [Legionella pneumophila]|nr:hypothetical protein PGH46_06545 [Legionella pneumophila]